MNHAPARVAASGADRRGATRGSRRVTEVRSWAPLAPSAALASFETGRLTASAELPGDPVCTGVPTDMNGVDGTGSATAARPAAEDAAAFLPGATVEVIGAGHRDKADVARGIAREWIATRGVDAVADVPVPFAGPVNEVVRGASRTAFIASGAGTSDPTGPRCSPGMLHRTHDPDATGHAVTRTLPEAGEEARGSWDNDDPVRHTPAEAALRPIESGGYPRAARPRQQPPLPRSGRRHRR